jgi:hypothetical protein
MCRSSFPNNFVPKIRDTNYRIHEYIPIEMNEYNGPDMNEYNGPDIDWNSYNLQFMPAQLSKTMLYSNKEFNNINKKLDQIYEKMRS